VARRLSLQVLLLLLLQVSLPPRVVKVVLLLRVVKAVLLQQPRLPLLQPQLLLEVPLLGVPLLEVLTKILRRVSYLTPPSLHPTLPTTDKILLLPVKLHH